MQIRSYKVFLSSFYAWGMLLLLPVCLILVNMVLERFFGLLSVLACYGIYIFVDVLADFWVFGGICAKDSSKMDFVKSSYAGYPVMKAGIVIDVVRRFLGMVIVSSALMGYYLFSRDGAIARPEALYIGIMILTPYLVNMVMLNITRYIEVLQLILFLLSFGTGATLGFLAEFGITVRTESVNVQKWSTIVLVLAVLAVVVTVITIWHMLHRIRSSYRDVS